MLGALPATSVQVADGGLKAPVEFEVKVTIPVGTAGLVELSITLAVQLVELLTKIDPGEQVTTVFVGWTAGGGADETARLKLPVLAECVESPP
jgi:hypothetical protein